jgi:hypothetical protein
MIMETLKALLELFPSRAPYLFILLGVATLLAAIVPFRIEKAGWALRNPSSRGARAALLAVGLCILAASLYAATRVDDAELSRLAKKRVSSYFSYVTISGTEADCVAGRCRLVFRDSALILAPKGEDASYEGRVKTSGRIVAFSTSPRADILNPEQYPANPTYVEFRIRAASPDDRQLEAKGEAVIERAFSPTSGKVGPHLPYFTEYAVFVLDLRSLGFKIQSQVEPKIETRRSDGSLISGYVNPRLNVFEDGKVFVVTATNVAAGSSLYVSWGAMTANSATVF